MKMEDIDPCVKMAVDAVRKELEADFAKDRLRRCLKGQHISRAWERDWTDFIDNRVALAAPAFPALRKHYPLKRSDSPTAPKK
jgi:hypothetical protein